jgi:hypothetical protein
MTSLIPIHWTGTLIALFEHVKERDHTITDAEFINGLIQLQLMTRKVAASDVVAKVEEMRASERRTKL